MAIEINTKVSVGQTYGKGLPNIELEDAKFWGKPNFSGELDRFKDARRKFTVLIPNDVADTLREIGYNVKTTCPTEDQAKEGLECISFLKVMVDDSSDVWVVMGEEREKLTPSTETSPGTFGVMDKVRVETMDMELRAWNYNKEEVDAGVEQPMYSARLVAIVANIRPNMLEQKYGRLG